MAVTGLGVNVGPVLYLRLVVLSRSFNMLL